MFVFLLLYISFIITCLEHGYMKGKSKITVYQDGSSDVPPKAVQRPLIDVIVETIAECSEEFDDEVQLKVPH